MPSPYNTLSDTCARANVKPNTLGMYTLASFISYKPVTLHRKQLTRDASVKGQGIDLADLLVKTCCNAARGAANMEMDKTKPPQPKMSAGSRDVVVVVVVVVDVDDAEDDVGDTSPASHSHCDRMTKVATTVKATNFTCCATLPGKVGDWSGAY